MFLMTISDIVQLREWYTSYGTVADLVHNSDHVYPHFRTISLLEHFVKVLGVFIPSVI